MGKREGRHRKRRAIPYGLTVVVLCTVCVVCFALPSVHEAHVRQIPRPTAALLSALEQGDEQLALHLLNDFNRSGSSFPQHRSRRRDCTPLMLAAGAAGRCWPRLVERILDFGLGIQAADVAAVSRSGRSAADYAELAGEGDLGIRTVSYLQQDLLDNGALQVLRERIDEVGYPTIVVGLHLCGNLSVFAVELFERLDTLRTCILVPCCLPHLRDAPNTLKHLYRRSVPDEQQYMEWASYLEARLAAIPKVTVSKTFAPHMKSKKRLILTAMKHHES
ncbi:Hypothetical protein SCF082_LOCUS46167 [Durusdinium trenchii]|uniref:Methyltransferase domain-containing protein n=1 Tax=Durusdinium trenchii TaxID=1381693 RepID=A0ABP0RDY6_9DINO